MLTPHYFQREAISSIYEYFNSGKRGNPLIGLPTGTGKSVVIALLIHSILSQWPRQRIVMLTHVSKLIEQNAARMLEVWPLAPVGINSAGLNRRDTAQPIIFGGVQSLYKEIGVLGWRDVLLVDEAHLIGSAEDAMYIKAIEGLKVINPNIIIIGFTATLYRMGMGDLTNGGIFTDVCYDMTDMHGFNKLIAEGYIAPLFAKPTQNMYDIKNVGVRNGDFNLKELEAAVDVKQKTMDILEEFVHYGQDRYKWIVFAAGISHAEHICDYLNQYFNVPTVVVHSKVKKDEYKDRMRRFEADDARCIVNNNVLTVGYDHKPIDYIGMLRHTMSTGLHVQMAGRGTRTSAETSKRDCLYMDFAGNVRRLGPINDPKPVKQKGKGTGDAPVRICPSCGVYNHASARLCMACGAEFSFKEKLLSTARTDEVLRSDAPIIQTLDVQRVLYARHVSKKEGAKPCLRVTYICGVASYTEFQHFDVGGGLGHKARDWWRLRMPIEPPKPGACHPFPYATDAVMSCVGQFRTPKRLRVHTNKAYPEIQSCEF